MKFFQYLSALFHLIGSKHFTTYFSQFFVQLMGRTLDCGGRIRDEKVTFWVQIARHLIRYIKLCQWRKVQFLWKKKSKNSATARCIFNIKLNIVKV